MKKDITIDKEDDAIAVIGLSCRFPGAENISSFWQNLKNGIESVSFFTDQELIAEGVNPSFLKEDNYVKAGCVIDDIDKFDNEIFGYSPREAEMIDPQQRIFLQCASECLEDAGYVAQHYEGAIGIFGGTRQSSYQKRMTSTAERIGTSRGFQALIGNDKDYLATRVSYKLNLKGPGVTVQTACSTSLVAVHMACESLRNGECDMALAGGVGISIPQKQGYFYQEGMIFSPDGHCRPFDEKARGIIGGNGAGLVLLKPFQAAYKDRDHIYAVIKGSAVNNDGTAKAGYTAPSIEGQMAVISEALAMADMQARDISYVETHGTGTAIGDPMEVEALTRVFREDTTECGFCAIGSVKSNVGHLDTAAGICSLIKTVLALKYGEIPPSLNFSKPNPRIDFDKTPFYVNTRLQPLKANGSLPAAGVSSFGIGGTNAHIVMQQFPGYKEKKKGMNRQLDILVLSATGQNRLQELAARYVSFLSQDREMSINEICYTANTGRLRYSCSLGCVVESVSAVIEKLNNYITGKKSQDIVLAEVESDVKNEPVAFLFTGQGSQYPRMAEELYRNEPVFREAVDRCSHLLEPYVDKPLLSVLYGEDCEYINETIYTQPSLFTVEYALAQLWISWGVFPGAVMGHGIGEYVAACIAGVYSLEDALKLVANRGRLIQSLSGKGKMAAVFCEADRLKEILDRFQGQVDIAAVNGPSLTVVSGSADAVDQLVKQLGRQEIQCKSLKVSHGFHSHSMDPVLDEFKHIAGEVSYNTPAIDFVSNKTGGILKDNEMCNADYWCEHIRQPVLFMKGLSTLVREHYRCFLEIGPDNVLSSLGERCVTEGGECFIPSIKKNDDCMKSLMNSLSLLACRGLNIDWKAFYAGYEIHKVALPTYPFAKRKFWVEDEVSTGNKATQPADNEIVDLDSIMVNIVAPGQGIESFREEAALWDKLVCYYISKALEFLGIYSNSGDSFAFEALLFQTELLPRHAQLVLLLLEVLVARGVFSKNESNEYIALKSIDEQDFEGLWETIETKGLLPDDSKGWEVITFLGDKLGPWLTGDVSGEQIVYDKALLYGYLDRFFPEARLSIHYINKIIGKIISCCSRESRIRIMEIGGRTGELTENILKQLPLEKSNYLFSALSQEFIDNAKERFQDFQFVEYEVFDPALLESRMDGEEGKYDIIIADKFLFKITNIDVVVEQINKLLARGGIFIVREPGEFDSLQTLLSAYELEEIGDERYPGNSLFYGKERWLEVFKKNGFVESTVLTEDKIPSENVFITLSGNGQSMAFGSEDIPVPVNSDSLVSIHPLLGRKYNMALPVFEYDLDCSRINYIEDHKIYGVIVVAGTVFFEMASAASRYMLNSNSVELKDIKVHESLLFVNNKQTHLVQTVFNRISYKDAAFEIYSYDESGAVWKLHCSGVAQLRLADTGGKNLMPHIRLDELIENFTREVSVDQLYESFWENGLNYGTEFRGIQEIKKDNYAVLGKIQLPENFEARVNKYHHHPVLLDSCMQIVMAALPEDIVGEQRNNGSAYMLVGIEELNIMVDTLPSRIWSYAKLRDETENLRDSFQVDYKLFDIKGNEIGEILGMQMKRAGLDLVKEMLHGEKENDFLYEVNWVPLENTPLYPDEKLSCFLLFESRDCGKLDGLAHRYFSIIKGKEFQCLDDYTYTINPASAEDFEKLCITLAEREDFICDGILYAWALDTPEEMDLGNLQQCQEENLGGLIHLTKTITKTWRDNLPPLGVITRNTQVILPIQKNMNFSLFQANIWGLGKVIANEYPELQVKLIDLGEKSDFINPASFFAESQQRENQLAVRNSVFYVPRMSHSFFKFSAQYKMNEGSYLITGGLGSLGLKLAKKLVSWGARSILLAGRNEVPEERKPLLESLRQQGVSIGIVKVDITDELAVRESIPAALREIPPLKGIFHLAGVLDDSILQGMDWNKFNKVLAPKVYGAWNLHEITRDQPLDFFVMFSSIASLFGPVAQANYAAANAFLDALAYYRQMNGLPGLSINWGAWNSDSGMGSSTESANYFESYGMRRLEVDSALEMLREALVQKSFQVSIMSVDWATLVERYAGKSMYSFLEKFTSIIPEGSQMGKDERTVYSQIAAANSENRKALLEDYLLETFAGLLRIPRGDISPELDFFQLGLDSLQFLELNQVLIKDLNVKITAAEAFSNPYIQSLIERLCVELEKTLDKNEPGETMEDHSLDAAMAIGGPVVPDMENLYEPFNLTNVQYAYWIGRSGVLDLGNVSCHFYFEVDRSDMDVSAFNQAWNKVVARHGMLRSFVHPGGQQQILPEVPAYHLIEFDLTSLSKEKIDMKLLETRHSMSHQIISSDQWPLFEIAVSLLPDGSGRLHFSIDLMIADVMSIQIIFTELAAFLNDPEFCPEPLELSFRDYVLAENKFRETELYEKSREYWIDQIENMPSPPDLPVILDEEKMKDQIFVSRGFSLDRETWGLLKKKALSHGLTPSGLLLAAYAEILGTWSANSQFIVSLTQFNRIPFHPDVNKIIGDFTSIIVMAMDMEEEETFSGRAKSAQHKLWSHLENRYFDGIQVLREMARGKRGGGEALVPVVYTSILGVGERSEEVYPWAILGKVGYFVSQTPQVWLDNQVSERNGCLIVNWDAVDTIFPGGMLDDMLAAYKKILLDLSVDDTVWNLPSRRLIPGEQLIKREMINATTGEISDHCLHSLFNEQVKKNKRKTAVISSEKTLDYGELSMFANHIAYLLRGKGVCPDSFVAVVMDKGWEQPVGVLSVLLAGAVYIPVDAALPGERMNQLLADSGVSIVLTQSCYVESISWPAGIQEIIPVDKIVPTSRDSDIPENVNQPTDIAYIIYTSGSTGKPKGVVIDHRGAVNTICDVNERFHIGADDSVLAISALNFDLSVYDIFGVLAAGGTVVIPDADKARDPAHWWQLIERYDITLWNTVPAVMQMLIDYTSAIPEKVPQSLRIVLLSGDWIPLPLPDKIRELFKKAKVISLGGATEASIWSIMYPVEKVAPDWKSIPYGKPMKNQQFYILDKDGNPCPDWVTGELYIGGIGVAKGYLNDTGQTSHAFIKKPGSGQIIYKTGDLGRYLPDGNIEFIGRNDFQVKVRGHRIELGDIEAALNRHEGVKSAIVNVYGNKHARKLYAYIMPDLTKQDLLFETIKTDETASENIWKCLVKTAEAQASFLPDILSSNTFPVFLEFMDNLTVCVMCYVFNSLGLFREIPEEYDLNSVMVKGGIDSRYTVLIRQWLDALVENKILSRNKKGAYKNKIAFAAELSVDMTYGDQEEILPWEKRTGELYRYFEQASPVYVKLLQGKKNLLDMFLKDDSLFTAESMSRFNPVRDYMQSIGLSIIESYADLTAGKKIRILEIGTRAGGMTPQILEAFKKYDVEYVYTDESSYFLSRVSGEMEAYDSIELKLFDINKDPGQQGFSLHNFDLIIGWNTLHRARNISESLGFLYSLLSGGGFLLICEGTVNTLMQLITVNLFEEGFVKFEDDRREQNLPLISEQKWSALLNESGFENFEIFPGKQLFGQSVFIARAPAEYKHFNPGILDEYLKQKLPEYMIPAGYEIINEIPVTANGKVDRKRLINPELISGNKVKDDYVAPKTDTEKKIAEIWEDILNVEQISVDDDFISLGGDSLQATQLVNKLKQVFDIDIPLRNVFKNTDVSALADYIDSVMELEKDFEEGIV